MRVIRLWRQRRTAYLFRSGSGVGKKMKTLSHQTLSVFVLAVLLFSLAGSAGFYSFIEGQIKKNNQTPHALTSKAPLPYAPAATEGQSGNKISPVSDKLGAELATQQAATTKGKAQNFKHVKLLAEGRSPNAKTYLNADGTRSIVYTAEATSYQDNNGKWQSVNTTLVKGKDGIWRTTANSWQASFGPANTYGVALEKDGQVFRMIPADANAISPAVKDNHGSQIVTYINLWNGVDLQYEVAGSQVKESIIVHRNDAVSNYPFAYSGASLSPANGADGDYALDGVFSGFILAAPTVKSNDGSIVSKDSPASQNAENGVITVSLDQSWLGKQPKKSFPLVIDPTVFNVPIGSNYTNFTAGGFICGAGSGCGNSVGHDAVNGDYWRFIYQAAVPSSAGQYLVSAKLHLEMPTPDGNDYGTTGNETISVDHASCTNGFNCIDTAGTYGNASAIIGSSGDIEMAPMYRAAVAASDTSPWMIVSGEETSADTYKFFDNTKTSVTFTYETLPTQSTIGTAAPVDGGSVASLQPTFTSTAPTDPDGPGPIQYRYIVGMGKSIQPNDPFHIKQGVTGVMSDSGLLPQAQWVVPANVLKDGATYYWQPVVWDSYSSAPQVYGPVYSFRVDLRYGKDATQAIDDLGPVSIDMSTGNVTTSNQTNSITALGSTIGLGLDYNSPARSNAGLVGQYWNDPSGTLAFPSSAPALTRVDSNVNFNWDAGSPYAGVISTDHFLARWTGYFVAPQTGTYLFGTTSDDRSRIFLNGSGTAYYDGWSANPSNQFGAGVALTAGQVIQVKYEYADITGNASAQMLVKTSDGTIAAQAIPTNWLQTGIQSVATPHGLVGHYYTDDGTHTFPTNAADPTRTFLVRTDSSLNLNWGDNSPVPNGPRDHFMVRWTGYFTAPVADTYTFGAGSDDGVRVILNGSNTVVNSWADHSADPIQYASSGITLSQGQTIPITIEYYENTGNAQMALYVKQLSLGNPSGIVVDSSWLSPGTQVLPEGWNISVDADGTVSYDYAVINQSSVTLYDSQGQSHEYVYANGGFTPPTGETGRMVRNGDGTVTLQDEDGQTYVFNNDGTIRSITKPVDDLHPAALQYTYGTSNGSPVHLTQVTDPVSGSRWLKVLYSGDTNCPAAPSGFLSSAPVNMICATSSSDGNITGFFYKADANGTPRLARVTAPGSAMTDYGYDTAGRIVQVRDSLANDAVSAGVRSQDGTEVTQLTYDALGRGASLTLPAATAGATRQAHTYAYQPNNTSIMHVAGATEPNGFTRKVTYDGTFRTLTDTDISNLTTTTVWDSKKDLVLSSTEPTGLMTTYLYDYASRKTDSYGPAPATWFGADRKPLTSPTDYSLQAPHTQTGFDQGINGLAAAYYNVATASNGTGSSTAVLFGAPKGHTTGVGPSSGDVIKTWNATPPFTPDSGYGWGAALTGDVYLTATGNYSFRVLSNDGVRLWIDDNLVVNDWTDGAQRSRTSTPFAATYNATDDTQNWHRIRLDYYNKLGDTNARLELYMTPPGGSETSAIGSLLTPMYGLPTTQTTYDSNSNVGNQVVTSNYGSNPELGLVQSTATDPSGLNLVTANSYEAQGATGSYLRQTSKTLPGGASTNYTYYGATETRQNPCNTSQTFLQAGMLKITTQPDPDGAGAQTGVTTENVYDNSGAVVATRTNSDPWRCTTYDNRKRPTQVAIPALANTPNVTRSARTITYNYAVGGNPLVTSISDNSGTITTTVDLLGRTTVYADTQIASGTPTTYTTNYSYDALGRLSTRTGIGNTVGYVYDNNNRLTAEQYGGVTVAAPTYDAYDRMQTVKYSAAGKLALTINRDSLGRENGVSYSMGTTSVTQVIADNVTLSQSGQVVSGTEGGNAKTYAYDKAGRLTNATYGTNTFAYSYGTPTSCTGTYNVNAGKDSNQTSKTVNGSVTRYCYDNADRLISSTNSYFTTPTYDAHGNLKGGNSSNTIEYDSSDRAAYIGQNSVTNSFDPVDRQYLDTLGNTYSIFSNPDQAPAAAASFPGSLNSIFLYLPGGVIMTLGSSSTATNAGNVYSLPNFHGDIITSAQGNGNWANTAYAYDPYGNPNQPLGFINNYPQSKEFGYLGKMGVLQDSFYTAAANYMQMGARLYVPTIGRFAQTDPVEDGNANVYVYPADPIDSTDLSGEFSIGPKKPFDFRMLTKSELKRVDVHLFKKALPGKSKIELYVKKGDPHKQVYYRNAKGSGARPTEYQDTFYNVKGLEEEFPIDIF
jgi:RHS repeat-associated protein